jgi:phenylalanyl-tRNA synthetase alpha chain
MTVELLRSGEWSSKPFKDYNFQAKGRLPEWGSLHPLLKVRTQFRSILLEMGFEEMPTNKWVESSFWNFDALFQPQQHPARDAHDTFFLSSYAASSDHKFSSSATNHMFALHRPLPLILFAQFQHLSNACHPQLLKRP